MRARVAGVLEEKFDRLRDDIGEMLRDGDEWKYPTGEDEEDDDE